MMKKESKKGEEEKESKNNNLLVVFVYVLGSWTTPTPVFGNCEIYFF